MVSRQPRSFKPSKRIRQAGLGLGFALVCVFVFVGGGQISAAVAGEKPALKAAIVDHLSGSFPNPHFVSKATTLLAAAGYSVDYYEGGEVTVELYRTLPSHDYDLILLRVHSAYIPDYLSLALFTSEPYSKHRYVYEQLRNRVAAGFIEPYREGDQKYLVVTDKFVRFSMEGSFDDAMVIMMGCTGIKKCAASAFLEKGARAYIGWTGSVSAAHTDRTTLRLLQEFLQKDRPVKEAVMGTMKAVGPDPNFNSMLLYWPIGAGNETLLYKEAH